MWSAVINILVLAFATVNIVVLNVTICVSLFLSHYFKQTDAAEF